MQNLFALAHIRLMNAYAGLRDREEGQGMTEYAVLVGAIVAMVLVVVGVLSDRLQTFIGGLAF
jgi:Flp pilus assembly pilin Flp